MADVRIRQATEADLAAILEAYTKAGIGAGISFTLDEAREHFARFAQYPNYRVFVAEADGRFVGTYALAILDNLAKRGAPCGVVEDVAVLPATQGQGVGRAMMEHAREECRKAGCYKVTLSSGMPREGAHRFYESLGFERHGYSFLIRP
jgi:GNAT superfamily N-acetyltransferase